MQRSSSTLQRGDDVGDGTGATRHRTAAADSSPRSRSGRTSSASARLALAANCSRRVAGSFNPAPSATITPTAGLLRHNPTAHSRSAGDAASTKIDRLTRPGDSRRG